MGGNVLPLVVGFSVVGVLRTMAHPLMEVLMGFATMFVVPAIVLAGAWLLCLLALGRQRRWPQPTAAWVVWAMATGLLASLAVITSGRSYQRRQLAGWTSSLKWVVIDQRLGYAPNRPLARAGALHSRRRASRIGGAKFRAPRPIASLVANPDLPLQQDLVERHSGDFESDRGSRSTCMHGRSVWPVIASAESSHGCGSLQDSGVPTSCH